MAKPTGLEQKVYDSLKRPEFLPDEFKSWLVSFLSRNNTLKVNKSQLASVLGESWHIVGNTGEPAFLNSWVPYGSTYLTPRFYKDYTGMVHLNGIVKLGAGAPPLSIFQLPAGYRPEALVAFTEEGADASTNRLYRVQVDAAGTVQVSSTIPAGGAHVSPFGFLFIDNIHFRAFA